MKKETTMTCENVYIHEKEEERKVAFNMIIANIINAQMKQVGR